MALSETILWHDFETWGVNPSVDFPVQFAAVRTDTELNIIEEQAPINWMCRIPHDYLPHPQACLVTGITPALSINKGMSEPYFANRIYKQMATPQSCTAGYNSIKFDEEVTRHLFYRNFYPVYDREYKNGNSRWDIIDLVRACYALRPEGIQWPLHENGKPSFRLEDLTQANDISHQSAHDALSDVYATIAMAKLIKQKQPKLYDFYWNLRNKNNVASHLHQFLNKVFVYVGGFIKSEQGCCTLILPICQHPSNRNAVLCIDLLANTEIFNESQSVETKCENIAALMFASKEEKEANPGTARPRIYSIAINKCPFVAPYKTLSEENAQRFGINIQSALQNAQRLTQCSNLSEICQAVYKSRGSLTSSANIDQALYTIGFPEPADMSTMGEIREAAPEQLVSFQGRFINEQLNQLLFRYRARNYPQLLEADEVSKWQQHIERRFTQSSKAECLSLTEYFTVIEELNNIHLNNPKHQQILQSLRRYGEQMLG